MNCTNLVSTISESFGVWYDLRDLCLCIRIDAFIAVSPSASAIVCIVQIA